MKVPRFARILVVEDNDPRFATLKLLFTHPRVRLVRAATGGAALISVRSDPYGFILLDHDLEESLPNGLFAKAITGFEVARQLVKPGPNRQTPVRIHSMNIEHRQEMCAFLIANDIDAEVVPMNTWTAKMAKEWIDELVDDLDD